MPRFRPNRRRALIWAADSWRCVECHGSDYKGRHGIAGIRGRQGGDPAAVVALLEDATHGYRELLRKDDLLDLAHFVTGGQLDLQAVLASWRPSKSAAADVERRFGSICAGCHGLDGGGLREIGPLGDAARQVDDADALQGAVGCVHGGCGLKPKRRRRRVDVGRRIRVRPPRTRP